MKKALSLLLVLSMALALTACGSTGTDGSQSTADPETVETQGSAEPVELIVFAAASLTETLEEIIENYKSVVPNVTITPTYDSSGTLLDQIQAGAECDLFLSAGASQMDTLEQDDGVLEGSRLDLLENKVALAVPEGNPKGIESFDQLSELL